MKKNDKKLRTHNIKQLSSKQLSPNSAVFSSFNWEMAFFWSKLSIARSCLHSANSALNLRTLRLYCAFCSSAHSNLSPDTNAKIYWKLSASFLITRCRCCQSKCVKQSSK